MEAMTGVLDQEAADRALLVGSSLGGYMSLEFAGRLPDRVAGLVLSGCSLNIRGAAALPFQIGARVLGRVSERWLIRVHEELCRRMFPPAFAASRSPCFTAWRNRRLNRFECLRLIWI